MIKLFYISFVLGFILIRPTFADSNVDLLSLPVDRLPVKELKLIVTKELPAEHSKEFKSDLNICRFYSNEEVETVVKGAKISATVSKTRYVKKQKVTLTTFKLIDTQNRKNYNLSCLTKMKRTPTLLELSLLLSPNFKFLNNFINTKVEDHEKKQDVFLPVALASYAGYEGMIGFGIGTYISPYFFTKVSMGYTPGRYVSRESGLTQYNVSSEFHPLASVVPRISISERYKIRIDPLYLGASFIMTPPNGDGMWFKNPSSRYPEGYYKPTSFDYTSFLGTAIGLDNDEGRLIELNAGWFVPIKDTLIPAVKAGGDFDSDIFMSGTTYGFGLKIYIP